MWDNKKREKKQLNSNYGKNFRYGIDQELKGMKSSILCGFILAFLITLQTVNAETVNAQIADYYFPTGDWYRGSNQGGANVDIVNTGDVGHQFWVKYSVMDSRGQWYDADLQSVYLNSSEQTNGMICLTWQIPGDAAIGNCQGRFTVWGGYDENADSVYNLLDERDLAGAFRIVG